MGKYGYVKYHTTKYGQTDISGKTIATATLKTTRYRLTGKASVLVSSTKVSGEVHRAKLTTDNYTLLACHTTISGNHPTVRIKGVGATTTPWMKAKGITL